MRHESLIGDAPHGVGQTAGIDEGEVGDAVGEEQKGEKADAEIGEAYFAPVEDTQEGGGACGEDVVAAALLKDAAHPVADAGVYAGSLLHEHEG